MATKSLLSKIGGLLQRTEMFERPSKQIPGKWVLYEYFVDKAEELVHLQEMELKEKKEFFEMDFQEDEFSYQTNLEVPIIKHIKNGKFSIAKNYITILDENNFRDNVDFQFAFEKGNLKLLKKDAFGKIEFFGFFKKAANF